MPISAVVVTLDTDEPRRHAAVRRLSADPRIVVGEPRGPNLPLVLETDTVGESITLVREELPALEAVKFVHVVSIDFSDCDARDELLPRRRRKSDVRSGGAR